MTGTLRPTSNKPRILVVDDEPVNIQAMHQIFRQTCDVFMATSGQEALMRCSENPPDLVLLDILMPDMNGLEVCRQLHSQEDTRDIPVIFVTSLHTPEEETAALDAGGVDFITKPLNPSVVKARVRTHLTLKAQSDLLRSLAFLDGLTGLANRRRFDEVLLREYRRAQRSAAALSLLMIDIDFFKRYNDRYGHQAGDDCLRQVARIIGSELKRSHDLGARYGGEEFACILPETDCKGANSIASAILSAITGLRIPHDASPERIITASIGVASTSMFLGEGPQNLVQDADARLYEAKMRGRNQIVSATGIG